MSRVTSLILRGNAICARLNNAKVSQAWHRVTASGEEVSISLALNELCKLERQEIARMAERQRQEQAQ